MKYKLDDIEKKSAFKVPEGYFEDLPMRIQKRVESESPQRSTFRLPSWSFAMAASVLLVISFVFIFNTSDQNANELLAEVPEADLIAYLDQVDVDIYDLASTFTGDSESLQFDELDMLNGLDVEEGSLDSILEEYNLEDEYLEI